MSTDQRSISFGDPSQRIRQTIDFGMLNDGTIFLAIGGQVATMSQNEWRVLLKSFNAVTEEKLGKEPS